MNPLEMSNFLINSFIEWKESEESIDLISVTARRFQAETGSLLYRGLGFSEEYYYKMLYKKINPTEKREKVKSSKKSKFKSKYPRYKKEKNLTRKQCIDFGLETFEEFLSNFINKTVSNLSYKQMSGDFSNEDFSFNSLKSTHYFTPSSSKFRSNKDEGLGVVFECEPTGSFSWHGDSESGMFDEFGVIHSGHAKIKNILIGVTEGYRFDEKELSSLGIVECDQGEIDYYSLDYFYLVEELMLHKFSNVDKLEENKITPVLHKSYMKWYILK